MSPRLRMFTGLVTEGTRFVKDLREADERLRKFDTEPPTPENAEETQDSRREHEETVNQLRNDFGRLNPAEQKSFKEFFDERKILLEKLQPKDPQTKDPDERESMRRLEDLLFLGKTLGLE